jgi:hypothetical protein
MLRSKKDASVTLNEGSHVSDSKTCIDKETIKMQNSTYTLVSKMASKKTSEKNSQQIFDEVVMSPIESNVFLLGKLYEDKYGCATSLLTGATRLPSSSKVGPSVSFHREDVRVMVIRVIICINNEEKSNVQEINPRKESVSKARV